MQIFIKEARDNYLEVIDLDYPQYLFVLDEIDFKENNGELEIIVNKLSTLKSIQKKGGLEIPDDMEDDFLENHAQVIIKEVFDSVLSSSRP